ncbi:helix-turn-helix transcriptional regulator [Elizabethkingia meningoseptica]|uniref:helix-turn-helix transcriptional regulator n=1 Tax=Elizabethkingia meningoseptica TaxID=238 RepID=UPI0038916AE1
MNKVKPENTSNTFVYAALLTVIALGFSYYTYKRVKILETKRKLLENETEILKIQVHDKLFDEVVELAKKNDSAFFTKFIALYPDFISELQKINPDLKRSELMFCAMLKLNFSSKEIASITGVLHTSIQKRKNKIRKRLNISSDADIYYFFDQLG